MRSLGIIQTLAKIGKVLSTIVYICCIIGAICSLVGIACVPIADKALKINGVTFYTFIHTEAGISIGTLYATLAAGMIICICDAVIAKFAKNYFAAELIDGTPFTLRGAGELRRLGIICIAVSLGGAIVASIVNSIIAAILPAVAPLGELGDASSVGIGIVFIIMSVIFTYGAQIKGQLDSTYDSEQESGD